MTKLCGFEAETAQVLLAASCGTLLARSYNKSHLHYPLFGVIPLLLIRLHLYDRSSEVLLF